MYNAFFYYECRFKTCAFVSNVRKILMHTGIRLKKNRVVDKTAWLTWTGKSDMQFLLGDHIDLNIKLDHNDLTIKRSTGLSCPFYSP